MRRPLAIVSLILLAMLCCSCSSKLKPFPVKGKILVDGKPAKDALIAFYHVEEWGPQTIIPLAWTDDNGDFSLTTNEPEDGAPAGDYEITIKWPTYRTGKSMGPDQLKGKYSNPKTSNLRARVEKKDNELEAFRITLPAAEDAPGQSRPNEGKKHD